jgi:hypothetical protein
MRKVKKKQAMKPEKKRPLPQERSATEHKKALDQLLDDSIYGVKKK